MRDNSALEALPPHAGEELEPSPKAKRPVRGPGAAIPFRTKERSDRLFEFFRGAEGHFLRGLDLHRLTRRRVAAHAGGALAHHENAETDEANAIAFLEVLGEAGHQVVEQSFGLLLRHVVALGQFGREMFRRDGGLLGFCGCGHDWGLPWLIRSLNTRNLRGPKGESAGL